MSVRPSDPFLSPRFLIRHHGETDRLTSARYWNDDLYALEGNGLGLFMCMHIQHTVQFRAVLAITLYDIAQTWTSMPSADNDRKFLINSDSY